jgi:hypothetical protein
MKLKSAISSLLVAGCCFGFASPSFAASCNSTLGPLTTAGSVPTANDCGHNLNYSGSFALCGGVGFSTTGTDVYEVTLAANQNFTFSVSSSDFQPDIALLSVSCADNASCVNGTDYIGGPLDSPPSVATSATVSGQAAGTYFLVITDSTGTGAQCGNYDLTLTGTLPVKLQDFSVE